MSGDVQPRKRKDKKKKKDDLGVEEPRGTAAALGEGDVFMHSQSEHGTGGHWCAKVIFFSLLAVLITLIGLIILENRGLTELEASSVESRYSGVLEGWIEDAPDDDHHDEHTLELKHHDDDDDDHGSELEHDDHDDDDHDDDDHDDDDHDDDENEDHENDDDDENEEDDDHDNENDEDEPDADDSEEANDNADDEGDDQESEEHDLHTAEENEDDVEEPSYKKYYENIREDNDDDDDDDDDLQKEEIDNEQDSAENRQDDDDDDVDPKELDDNADDDKQDDDSLEAKEEEEDNDDDNSNDDYLQNDAAHEDEDEHEEEEPANIEIESIEKEVSDDDVASTEEPAEEGEDQSEEVSEELPRGDDSSVEDDDVEFLEPDELDELPIVEPITAPKGKPLPEVGDNPTEKPQDTLADEEEYERQQEELRKEREQASQGMWLKLTVGGALLVATHAVLRRATASRETETEDEPDFREETPISDRRMTLISDPVPPPTVAPKAPEAPPIEKEVIEEAPTIVQTSPTKQDLEEEEEEIIVKKPTQLLQSTLPTDTIDRELYSDEEELEEEVEDEEEEEIIQPTKTAPQQAVPQTPHIPDVTKEVTPEPEEDDDVEIIDEEQLEEELEEEEISDVDDAELLNRLEEKYGRLPEPERPGRTHKDGGNSIEDEWPGEPADAFWSAHLEQAQRELRQGEWMAAVETASAPNLASSARAKYIAAQALDAAAEAKKDNKLLNRAVAAYLDLLKMNERLSDKKLLEVATRAVDRIKFRGTYLNAEPVYKLLIRRFPNDPTHRNNLTISLLMANRADLAEDVLKETLKLWPNDRVALAHHGFILKTLHNRLEEAVEAFSKALEGDAGAANEPRFYFHLGDALLLLGRFDEAHEVHKRGAALGHFLSPNQRSLYNVDRLKSKPWWSVDQTPYSRLARALETSWKEILKEGEAAKAMYEKEKEGLKERGEWSQLDLFVRGREVPNRCSRAPITCGIVKSELAASGCRRGQIKFSMMEAGTHVRPHVGPTNCRLRMHLGLSNTKDTFIRVDRETRQWQTGKVLMFDDSFEHEVWHNGTGTRLVLIVDVWHPDLTPAERRQLPAI